MKPWSDIDLAQVPRLPAMLGGEELQFLYWLGMTSDGRPLVDLGTFLGGSAACLAAGAERSSSRSLVYSYDTFLHGTWCNSFDMGDGWTNGDDTLPWVKGQLAPWEHRVQLIKGDISQQRWEHGPTGALFVDFTQTWQHHNHVCRAFLPSLSVGGVLAHQDYVYIICYWLHVFMEKYADHFEQISPLILNSTAAWRYIQPLPQEALERGLNELLSLGEMERLIDQSIEKYTGIHKGLLQLARVRFVLHTRGPDAALADLERIESNLGTWENLVPLIEITSNNISHCRTHGAPYPKGFFNT